MIKMMMIELIGHNRLRKSQCNAKCMDDIHGKEQTTGEIQGDEEEEEEEEGEDEEIININNCY